MIEPGSTRTILQFNGLTDLGMAGFLHAGTGFSAKERQSYAVTQP
jgi:hypothetical protein